jgi:hypothetical protein
MLDVDLGQVVGDDGVSLNIEVEEDTPESYILRLQDAVRELKTPNLRCQALSLIIRQVQELLDEFNVDLTPIIEKLDQIGSLPKGGYAGQVLEKTSSSNFDAQWVDKTANVDISGKADRVTSATSGNFAGLNAIGNLTDSGKKTADFVQMTGAQTVAGVKTFSSIPVLPASDPTTDNQAARKAYVDSKVTSGTPGSDGKGIKNVTANVSVADLPNQGWRVGDMLWPGDTSKTVPKSSGSGTQTLSAYTLYAITAISTSNITVESRGYLKGLDGKDGKDGKDGAPGLGNAVIVQGRALDAVGISVGTFYAAGVDGNTLNAITTDTYNISFIEFGPGGVTKYSSVPKYTTCPINAEMILVTKKTQ